MSLRTMEETDPVLKSGNLAKQSPSLFKGWQTRYFVLTKTALKYSKSPSEAALASIALSHIISVSVLPEMRGLGRLRVNTTGKSLEIRELPIERGALTGWIKAFASLNKKVREVVPEGKSLMVTSGAVIHNDANALLYQGFLRKKSPSIFKFKKEDWQIRYFVLRPHSLIYYASEEEFNKGPTAKPSGKIMSGLIAKVMVRDPGRGRFDLVCAQRTYQLRTMVPDDLDGWVKALQSLNLRSHRRLQTVSLGKLNLSETQELQRMSAVAREENAKQAEAQPKLTAHKSRLEVIRARAMSKHLLRPSSTSELRALKNTPEKIEKRRVTRTRVAREIMQTEATYVSGLQAIVMSYQMPLQAKGVLAEQQISALFSNSQTIYQLHANFLEDLTARIEQWDDNSTMGDLFIAFTPFFKMTTKYIDNYTLSYKLFADLCKTTNFAAFLAEVQTVSSVPQLGDLLISPIQRIPRYKLLLEELLKNTELSHPDSALLEEALNQVAIVAKHINESVRQRENRDRIMSIESKFSKNPVFVSPSRVLLKEGTIRKQTKKTQMDVQMFVFNDMLAYAGISALNKQLTLKQKLAFDEHFEISLPDDDEVKAKQFGIVVTSRVKSFVLYASSTADRDLWYSTMVKALEEWSLRREHYIELKGDASGGQTAQYVAPVMAADHTATRCDNCHSKFSVIRRRHHCRLCGQLFCETCTTGRITVQVDGKENVLRACDACVTNRNQQLQLSAVEAFSALKPKTKARKQWGQAVHSIISNAKQLPLPQAEAKLLESKHKLNDLVKSQKFEACIVIKEEIQHLEEHIAHLKAAAPATRLNIPVQPATPVKAVAAATAPPRRKGPPPRAQPPPQKKKGGPPPRAKVTPPLIQKKKSVPPPLVVSTKKSVPPPRAVTKSPLILPQQQQQQQKTKKAPPPVQIVVKKTPPTLVVKKKSVPPPLKKAACPPLVVPQKKTKVGPPARSPGLASGNRPLPKKTGPPPRTLPPQRSIPPPVATAAVAAAVSRKPPALTLPRQTVNRCPGFTKPNSQTVWSGSKCKQCGVKKKDHAAPGQGPELPRNATTTTPPSRPTTGLQTASSTSSVPPPRPSPGGQARVRPAMPPPVRKR